MPALFFDSIFLYSILEDVCRALDRGRIYIYRSLITGEFVRSTSHRKIPSIVALLMSS